MDNTKINELVIKSLANRFDTTEDAIKMESNLKNDFGMDSLDAVEIIMELEDLFEIEILDQDFYDVNTVNELINLVEKKLSEAKKD